MVTTGGPYYVRLAEIDFTQARRNVEEVFWLPLHIARCVVGKVRPDGTLLFIGGTGGRRPAAGPLITAFTAMPALTKALAVELASGRVNLIAAGFVDTPRCRRREQLRTTLPIRGVVGPADIAALAVHLMINTAITGATYDIDGGQQLVEG